MTTNNETPTMRQYHRAKAECPPGTILLFRLGDFYEMFEADATAAAAILGLTLTKRQGVPMCGVPYHAAELYISKLLDAGRKVALCDELAKPSRPPEPERPRPQEPPRPSKFGVLVNVSAKTAREWIARTDAAARAIGREIKFEVKQAWEKKGIMYPDSAENILRLCQHGRGLTVIAWKDYPDFPPLFAEELDTETA